MYIPEAFNESRTEVLHQLIRERPLATLITYSQSGLNANHVPLYLHEMPAPLGTLQGHVARSNPLVHELHDGSDALVVFHGPQAYISPTWYVTKEEHGRVVPTWNYVVVHAYGRLRLVEDADWLRAQLKALTDQNEAMFAQPWSVTDAPADYIERLMNAIVGIEMPITKLVGKCKLSQNQPASNRESVIEALRAKAGIDAVAMAGLIAGAWNDAH